MPFRAEFVAATDWTDVELSFPVPFRQAGAHFRSVDEAVALLKRYFALGLRPVRRDAVRVVIPEGHEQFEELQLFVEVTGGVNAAQAGSQFRIWIRRDGGGWTVDRMAEARLYCLKPFAGFSGLMCLDE